jgi:hypothetical protein
MTIRIIESVQKVLLELIHFLSESDISTTLLLRDLIDLCRARRQPISEVQVWDSNQGSIKLKSIGSAYNQLLTNLKHSCDPNTVR